MKTVKKRPVSEDGLHFYKLMPFPVSVILIFVLAPQIYGGPADADLSTFDITKGGAYRSYGTTAIRFIYPNKTVANASVAASFAIDPVGKRIRFNQGKYGSVYIRSTSPSYGTYPLPNGSLVCGTIDGDYDLELRELSLLTHKGEFRSKAGKGGVQLLDEYSGFATEVSQCGMATALGIKLDKKHRVRFVTADTPFEPIGRGKLIVSQYMDLPQIKKGIDESDFALDPVCLPPHQLIPWCQVLLPNGPFALFNLSYFS